jgi:hypothetical protein
MKKMILSTLGLAMAFTATTAFAAEPAGKPPIMTPAMTKEFMEQAQKKMFEDNDTDKDGTISKSEWAARGEKAFNGIDANKDGKITLEEMKGPIGKSKADLEKRPAEKVPPVKQ